MTMPLWFLENSKFRIESTDSFVVYWLESIRTVGSPGGPRLIKCRPTRLAKAGRAVQVANRGRSPPCVDVARGAARGDAQPRLRDAERHRQGDRGQSLDGEPLARRQGRRAA